METDRLIAAVALGAILLTAGCNSAPPPTVGGQGKAPGQQARIRYLELCAACHGQQGRGGVGPDLSATRYRYGKQRSQVITSIMEGRPGGMPAYGSHLRPDEAAAMADYLLSLQ